MSRCLLLVMVAATLAVLPALWGWVALAAVDSPSILHPTRSSPGDLEVGGELAGLPSGTTRYVRYEDLLRLPQESYTVSDDTNLAPKTTISGVALATLARVFGRSPQSDLIVAICYDHYRTNYPLDYLAAHHPLLVLRINGQLRDKWPRSADAGGSGGEVMGPYLISHPLFKPAFKVLSHEDEPQIPFGVTRIELRRESVVLGAIRPRGKWLANSPVEQGYTIARQDCFRCHNMGAQGGTMGGYSWLQLASIAQMDGGRFRRIIHDPASVTPGARMPAHTDYDEATLNALTAYFITFSGSNIRAGSATHSSVYYKSKSDSGRQP